MDAKQVFFPVLKGTTARSIVKNIMQSMARIEENNDAVGDENDEDYQKLKKPFPPKRGRFDAVLSQVTHLQLQDFINRRAQLEHDSEDKDSDEYYLNLAALEAYELYTLGYVFKKDYEYEKELAR